MFLSTGNEKNLIFRLFFRPAARIAGFKLLENCQLPLRSLYPLAELSALFTEATGDDEIFFFLGKVVEL